MIWNGSWENWKIPHGKIILQYTNCLYPSILVSTQINNCAISFHALVRITQILIPDQLKIVLISGIDVICTAWSTLAVFSSVSH